MPMMSGICWNGEGALPQRSVLRQSARGAMTEIREFDRADYPVVQRIYREGIESGDATFQSFPPEWDAWDRATLAVCRLVAEEKGAVVGWIALSPVSGRCVFAGVAEVSIYIAAAARGRGVGQALLSCLIEASERAGIWTLEAGIFPENRASIALHERNGFRVVGVRERLGRMGDRWRDVLLLERRSKITGV
jgi:L-amino acid N-acyltransferase YncA